ncbi:extracellular solute-binding protein [Paenibacillus agaridevorans]|uniref:extracellular solute-binding protein n=1 Tax=Paenibacillus agaridevorans TaxID=171404 RepID=UPI001BE48071|nr:extracellular solute-binding protein [Paenibacillus agaridevorans]
MNKKMTWSSLALILCMVLFAAGCSNAADTKEGASNLAPGSTTPATGEQSSEEADNYENGLPKNEEVTLKVGLLESGYGREWFDYAVKLFTEKYPNVKFDITASPKIGDLVSTKAAAGNDDDMFDLFYSDTWTEYVNANKLEPVTGIFEMSPDDAPGQKLNDLIVPGFNDPEKYYKDNAWVFPIANYIGGMFFDQKLFDENGWNKSPKTYDEFIQLCEAIKSKGIDPIVYAGLYNYAQFAFDTKIFEIAEENENNQFRNDFEYFNGPQNTSPENIEVYKRLYDMGKKGYISKKSVGMNHTQSQMLVLQHKAAMVPSGDWIENEMKESAPDDFQWGYMAVPFTNNPDGPIYMNNGLSYSFEIWAAKPELNKKWAKQFLLSLMSNEVQQELVEKGGALPLRKDYLDVPTRADNMKPLQKSIATYMKENQVVLELKNRKIELTHPDYAASLKVIVDNMALVLTGQEQPEPFLQDAEKLLQNAVKNDKEAQNKE